MSLDAATPFNSHRRSVTSSLLRAPEAIRHTRHAPYTFWLKDWSRTSIFTRLRVGTRVGRSSLASRGTSGLPPEPSALQTGPPCRDSLGLRFVPRKRWRFRLQSSCTSLLLKPENKTLERIVTAAVEEGSKQPVSSTLSFYFHAALLLLIFIENGF